MRDARFAACSARFLSAWASNSASSAPASPGSRRRSLSSALVLTTCARIKRVSGCICASCAARSSAWRAGAEKSVAASRVQAWVMATPWSETVRRWKQSRPCARRHRAGCSRLEANHPASCPCFPAMVVHIARRAGRRPMYRRLQATIMLPFGFGLPCPADSVAGMLRHAGYPVLPRLVTAIGVFVSRRRRIRGCIKHVMQEIAFIWASLFACLAVIGVAGVRLSRYGDIIAEKSGLSRGWVGLILLATVTSLPELVTGLSSVTIAQVPDIAVGDIMGSCVFNLLIIVVLDFLYRKESVYTRARQC